MFVKEKEDEVMNESSMKWYGHVKRMDENRMEERAFDSELTGVRKVDRPPKRWIDNREILELRSL